MFCIAKLIEMLTLQEQALHQIRADLPRVYHRGQVVRCPWTFEKGALMRHLVETHAAEDLELIDGVKVVNRQHDSWVLVLPDAGEPLVHIFANGSDRDWVDETLREYRNRVQDCGTGTGNGSRCWGGLKEFLAHWAAISSLVFSREHLLCLSG